MKSLVEAIREAGEACGRVRLAAAAVRGHHKREIRSKVADIKNTGGRQAGASTAAAFLWYFAGDTPWAHLDIAGTAWTSGRAPAYQPRGATGVGVRMLVEMLRSWDPARVA